LRRRSREEITIGFNSRYVLDALGAQAGEQVVLEVKERSNATAPTRSGEARLRRGTLRFAIAEPTAGGTPCRRMWSGS
jgi:hypothetical protein